MGSFSLKQRVAKIGRNIKKTPAVHIPEHFIPAFKPSKEFMKDVKQIQNPLLRGLKEFFVKKQQFILVSVAVVLCFVLFFIHISC